MCWVISLVILSCCLIKFFFFFFKRPSAAADWGYANCHLRSSEASRTAVCGRSVQGDSGSVVQKQSISSRHQKTNTSSAATDWSSEASWTAVFVPLFRNNYASWILVLFINNFFKVKWRFWNLSLAKNTLQRGLQTGVTCHRRSSGVSK